MNQCIMVMEQISDEPVDLDTECTVKEDNEDNNLAGIRCGGILA